MERPESSEAEDASWRDRLEGAAARIGRFLGKGVPISMAEGANTNTPHAPNLADPAAFIADRLADVRNRSEELHDQVQV